MGMENQSSPTDAVIFAGLSLLLGIACRHLLSGTKLPYTVALLLLGVALGSLEYGTKHDLGKIGNGIRLWTNIDPDLLLAVFLPAKLFESCFSMEAHQIKRCIMQMFLLAGPGVLISTVVLGSALKLIFPYGWNWKTSLLLGGLLSATDPVAVVALLKELGTSKKLSTIVEGESMMNDGIAIVVYQLFYRMVLGWSFDLGAIIKYLAQVSLGAVGIGLAFGIASVLWLRFMFKDTVNQITLTLAVSFVAYFTAQEGADISGILTVMTLGMFYSAYARTAFKGESQESLHYIWEVAVYIANTLIFILRNVGQLCEEGDNWLSDWHIIFASLEFVIAEGVLRNGSLFETNENSWGYLFLLYVFVQLSRVVVVGVLFPFLRYFGYGLNWKEAIIIVWSGIRGVIGLSLALSVKRTSDNSPFISSDTGTLFIFLTGGIVFLTLVINGSTTLFILQILSMDKLSEAKRRIVIYTKFEMLNKALEAFESLGEDEELGPTDWPTVKRYVTSLDDAVGEQVHPHASSETGDNFYHMNMTDTRVRFLKGVQTAYWGMLEEGRITQRIANLLMQSVDQALDLVSHETLSDWRGLSSYVNCPRYYKCLRTSMVPQKLIADLTLESLQSACCICAAFLRGHKIARNQLIDFIGNSDIALAHLVIKESEEEGEEAWKFLEEVRAIFPQVLHVVKTRQVAYSVLHHVIRYVLGLEKVGLLDRKEMVHLHDATQTDMKKLLRNPPSVKMQKIRDLTIAYPFLGLLPSAVRETLVGSSEETIELRSTTLYEEGSKPNAIWLISNGVVKVMNARYKNSLNSTFTVGSTLGLYELLTGKPYTCDAVTISVVRCVYIKAEMIYSALRSDPTLEDTLWRESVIVLFKLWLPGMFENLSVGDLRGIFIERSSMTLYSKGEIFEVPHQHVAFLLEGCVRSHGFQEELLTSPAALSPFQRSEVSGAGGTGIAREILWYEVDARARVILCDLSGFENCRIHQ